MVYEKPYSINHEKDRLIFVTSSFRPDKGSVLHKGIYSNEFASMLSALIICGVIYIFLAFNYKITFAHYLLLILTFIFTFTGFRKFIFKERYLKIVFDKSNKIARIIWPGYLYGKVEEISFGSINSVEIGSKKISPENLDGIEFVERISRQHGSAIPGLGEEVEFVTLLLKLTDGSERVIYAEKINSVEPEVPLKEINNFLKGQLAKKKRH